jgi:hypothetical protein
MKENLNNLPDLSDLPTTRLFEPQKVLFERDGFVVCSGRQPSKDTSVADNTIVAMRYTESSKLNIGYPNGMGKPQWFILPESCSYDELKMSNSIQIQFNAEYTQLEIGDWIEFYIGATMKDWGCVTHIYGDGNLKVCGLGKFDSFPVPRDMVVDIQRQQSAFDMWHGRNTILWETHGVFFITYPKDGHGGHNVYNRMSLIPKLRSGVKDNFVWGHSNQQAVDVCFFHQVAGSTMVARLEDAKVHEVGKLINNLDLSLLEDLPEVEFVLITTDGDVCSTVDIESVMATHETYCDAETYFCVGDLKT